jgi:hypothetical protein
MRHERGASALILGVGVPRDSKQQCHFVRWVASYSPCLPDPRGERRAIFFWRYAASPGRCYCSSASGSSIPSSCSTMVSKINKGVAFLSLIKRVKGRIPPGDGRLAPVNSKESMAS